MEVRVGHALRRSYDHIGCICNFHIDLIQQSARSNSKEEEVVLLTLEEVQSVVVKKTDYKAGSREQTGNRTQLENLRPAPVTYLSIYTIFIHITHKDTHIHI